MHAYVISWCHDGFSLWNITSLLYHLQMVDRIKIDTSFHQFAVVDDLFKALREVKGFDHDKYHQFKEEIALRARDLLECAMVCILLFLLDQSLTFNLLQPALKKNSYYNLACKFLGYGTLSGWWKMGCTNLQVENSYQRIGQNIQDYEQATRKMMPKKAEGLAGMNYQVKPQMCMCISCLHKCREVHCHWDLSSEFATVSVN